MKRLIALLIAASLFMLPLVAAAPANVFTLDDAIEIKVEGCDEAVLCRDYSFTVTLEALQDVTVRTLRVTVYCHVDCCEQVVYDKTLLEDYDLSPCCKKSWTITVRCCPNRPRDPWIRVKVWISYNFTNQRVDNATLLFNLAPLYRTSYYELYTAYQACKEKYEELSKQYEKLEDKYGELLEKHAELTAQYNQLVSQKASLEAELESKDELLAQLRSELESTQSELERVRQSLEETQRRLAEKEDSLRKLSADYEKLSTDYNACEAKYLSLVREHEKLKSDYNSTWSELTMFRIVTVVLLLALAAITVARYVLPAALARTPQPS